MRRSFCYLLALLILPVFAACERREAGEAADSASATEGAEAPLSTTSEAARDRFLQGRAALDMGRPDDARPHFQAAVEADPDFALGYLYLAFASNSLEGFRTNLAMAGERAAGASEAERLMIEATRKNFEDDFPGELDAAQRLTELQPADPRAWMILADAQSAMDDEAAARASLEKAIEVGPGFVPAHMALGNSYLFVEPRDLARAQTHMRKAVELAPDEGVPHDLLGDAYRAQGQLEKAAEEYGRTAELDPESGSGFQQRAHVHSFLGNFDQARADYDAAIEIEKGKNLAASFRVYRALVSVHEGNPKAAIDELERLVGEIDGMGIPEPRGLKIFALTNIARIALHTGAYDVARSAIERRNTLATEQAGQIGTDAARRDARAMAVLLAGELAARQGDHATAAARAKEYMEIMAPSADPGKDRPAHALLGLSSLLQGKHDEAIGHLDQADPNDVYAAYYRATAMEATGRGEEAKALFRTVATNNFNSTEFALVRKDATAKAGS